MTSSARFAAQLTRGCTITIAWQAGCHGASLHAMDRMHAEWTGRHQVLHRGQEALLEPAAWAPCCCWLCADPEAGQCCMCRAILGLATRQSQHPAALNHVRLTQCEATCMYFWMRVSATLPLIRLVIWLGNLRAVAEKNGQFKSKSNADAGCAGCFL